MSVTETTANTLSAIIGLLGAYPEAQQWLYESIKNTLGDREPVSPSGSKALETQY